MDVIFAGAHCPVSPAYQSGQAIQFASLTAAETKLSDRHWVCRLIEHSCSDRKWIEASGLAEDTLNDFVADYPEEGRSLNINVPTGGRREA